MWVFLRAVEQRQRRINGTSRSLCSRCSLVKAGHLTFIMPSSSRLFLLIVPVLVVFNIIWKYDEAKMKRGHGNVESHLVADL